MDPSASPYVWSSEGSEDREFQSVTWTADLGAERPLDALANHLHDLAIVVGLGERIAFHRVSHIARSSLVNRVLRRGLGGLQTAADEVGYELDSSTMRRLDEWFHYGSFGPGPRSGYTTPDVINILADARIARVLNRPAVVAEVSYRNPLEVVLIGATVLLGAGIIPILRLVRDWSSDRRVAAARARVAEASAELSIHREKTRTDLFEWMVHETMEGRLREPPRDLVDLVTQTDLQALNGLSTNEIRLELPAGADPGRPSTRASGPSAEADDHDMPGM